ncbi:MAG: NUDIX hydrolase [Spirochaetales bacterium]|nr:NUDIX hydrolase [Spirochaetales bacterium]
METKFAKMNLEEKQLDRSLIYDGNLLHLYKDNVLLPNGKQIVREYIIHPQAVAVVAMDDRQRIVIEHQFRYPFHSETLEIPAGKLDYEEEDLLEAVKRELHEETGITASEITYLCPFWPVCAYSTEAIHLFFARGLTFTNQRDLDEDENINVEMVPIRDVVQMIYDGKIPDAKTQAAVLQVWSRFCQKEAWT